MEKMVMLIMKWDIFPDKVEEYTPYSGKVFIKYIQFNRL
jgi:hypothetical protein